jgi:hypothetical protein
MSTAGTITINYNAPVPDADLGRMQRRANSSTKSKRSRAPFWIRWFGWLWDTSKGHSMSHALALSFTASLAIGCGGAPGAFRSTLAATAEAVKAADAEVAPAYGRKHARCLAASPGWSEYDACMGAQPALVRALEASDASLHTAEAALDSWDDQAEEGAAFFAFVPCLSRALSFLAEAFEAAGVEIPEAIRKGLSFAAAFGGACRGEP